MTCGVGLRYVRFDLATLTYDLENIEHNDFTLRVCHVSGAKTSHVSGTCHVRHDWKTLYFFKETLYLDRLMDFGLEGRT